MAFSLIYIAAIFGIFYFMLIRPQQKKAKQMKDMRESIKVGDTVVTIGGLVGRVIRITDDDVILDCGPGEQTFKKWAIGSVSE